ncbi:MAG: endonuclease/exonuclease/phosphatase [Thermoguttaceae bacterium]
MAKQLLILLAIAAAIGVGYFLINYDVQRRTENGRPGAWAIVPRGGSSGGSSSLDRPTGPIQPTFRIATFQLGRLDEAKLANRRVNDVLTHLLPRFDLIALQGVRGKNRGVLIRLVEQLNAASGRAYDFATCPTQQRDALEHYSAFVFDRKRINVDLTTVRFIEDRLGRFRVKPLMGLFQTREPDPAEAFTFVLIAVENDPDHAPAELDLLADAFRAVRDGDWRGDARREDDIILLGDLETDDRHLGQLGRLLGVAPLLSDVPTTARGANLLDNILLDRRATCEFTGRVEVVDMMREFDLTMPGTQEISEHLPVWAEFSVYEGGQAGHPMPVRP